MENKSILYYCKTVRQLLCSILLANKEPQEIKKYLFVNEWLYGLFSNIESLKKPPFNFYKIATYNTAKITSPSTTEPKTLVEDIVKYYDDILFKNGINLNEITEFNLFASLRFSLYLSEKQKKFNLFEDGNGSAITNGLVQWRETTDKVSKKKLAEDYGLIYGTSNLVENIYSTSKLDSKTFPIKKVKSFSPNEILNSLNDNFIIDLYNFFNNSKTLLKENFDYIILTQYYGIQTTLQKDIFWGIIADCFIPNNCSCAIKAHPADNTDFRNIFLNDKIYNKNIPYEIIEKSTKITNSITISSSSTAQSKTNLIKLGEQYSFYDTLLFYSILKIISSNCNNLKFAYDCDNQNIFSELINSRFPELKNNFVSINDKFDFVICNKEEVYKKWVNKDKNVFYITNNLFSIPYQDFNKKIILIQYNNIKKPAENLVIYCCNQNFFSLFNNIYIREDLKRTKIAIEIKDYHLNDILHDNIVDLQKKYDELLQTVNNLKTK